MTKKEYHQLYYINKRKYNQDWKQQRHQYYIDNREEILHKYRTEQYKKMIKIRDKIEYIYRDRTATIIIDKPILIRIGNCF